MQYDGRDAAHPVEEARLQPRERLELPPAGCRRPHARQRHAERHQQPAQAQQQGADRIGRQQRQQHQQRPGPGQGRGREPAAEEALDRVHLVDRDRRRLARVAQRMRAGGEGAHLKLGA